MTYIFIFLLLSFVALNNPNGKFHFYFAMILLGVLCVFRGNGVDRDYETYVSIYDYINNGYSYSIEPTFIFISQLSSLIFNSPFFIFVAYGILAIYFKIKFIKDWSPYIMLSVVIYFSNIYLLHEMTQIRIGLASSIGFYSLKYLLENNKGKFIFWVAVAILFHYSMAVFLLSLLFRTNEITFRYKFTYIATLLMFYALYFMNINVAVVLKYLNIAIIQSKYSMYQQQLMDSGIKVNVFSIIQILHLLIIIFAFSFSSYFINDKKFVLILKIFSLSPISLVAFSAIPGVSLRLSELFSVAEIVLLPMLVQRVKHIKVAYLFVIVISLSMLLTNIYYLSLVKDYSF